MHGHSGRDLCPLCGSCTFRCAALRCHDYCHDAGLTVCITAGVADVPSWTAGREQDRHPQRAPAPALSDYGGWDVYSGRTLKRRPDAGRQALSA